MTKIKQGYIQYATNTTKAILAIHYIQTPSPNSDWGSGWQLRRIDLDNKIKLKFNFLTRWFQLPCG